MVNILRSVRRVFPVTERGHVSACNKSVLIRNRKIGWQHDKIRPIGGFYRVFLLQKNNKGIQEVKIMSLKNIPYKIYLSEEEMPKKWLNLKAFMPEQHAPFLNLATGKPCAPEELEAARAENQDRLSCQVRLAGDQRRHRRRPEGQLSSFLRSETPLPGRAVRRPLPEGCFFVILRGEGGEYCGTVIEISRKCGILNTIWR